MSRRRTVAVDWDDVLVDAKTQEWLPDAPTALTQLLAEYHTVIIHTCRANWPEGLAQVEAKLEETIAKPWRTSLGDRLKIVGKPLADVYIDDRARRFEGDWHTLLSNLRIEALAC
jgi:hypothetical protein